MTSLSELTTLHLGGPARRIVICGSEDALLEAGESWDGFVARCIDEGLAGVECLSGIPGSVGATPIQNVGAYGPCARPFRLPIDCTYPATALFAACFSGPLLLLFVWGPLPLRPRRRNDLLGTCSIATYSLFNRLARLIHDPPIDADRRTDGEGERHGIARA